MRIEQTQSQVSNIVGELPIEVIPGPTRAYHCILVFEIFTQIVLELRIRKSIPFCLGIDQTITLGEVLSESHAETTRERQATEIGVLRRSTGSQRRDRRISEERHRCDSDTVNRREHLFSPSHRTQCVVRISDQRTHRRLR